MLDNKARQGKSLSYRKPVVQLLRCLTSPKRAKRLNTMKTVTNLSLAKMAAATAASTSYVSAELLRQKQKDASDERVLKKDKAGKLTEELSAVVDANTNNAWWFTTPSVTRSVN